MVVHFQSFHFKAPLHLEIWRNTTLFLMLEIISFIVKYETTYIQVIAELTTVSNDNYFLLMDCLDYYMF